MLITPKDAFMGGRAQDKHQRDTNNTTFNLPNKGHLILETLKNIKATR